jgi:hypothetical protein
MRGAAWVRINGRSATRGTHEQHAHAHGTSMGRAVLHGRATWPVCVEQLRPRERTTISMQGRPAYGLRRASCCRVAG